MESTFCRYSPAFYYFSVLTLIRPFSSTRPYSFSIVARILPFPGTRLDSTIFRYSDLFYPFRYSSGQFFDTRSDSTFSRYSPRFYHFLVVTLILLVIGTRPDSFLNSHRFYVFPKLSWILPFFDTLTDSTIFWYSSGQFFDTRSDSTLS